MGAILAVLVGLAQEDLETLERRFAEEKERPAAQRAVTLGRIGALRTEPAAEFLGRAFGEEKDLEVRRHILAGLADCGTEGAVRRLIAAAKDFEIDLSLREAAVEALGKTSSRQAFDFLVSFAREGGALRSRAFEGLLAFPLEGTEPLWREALEDPDPEIRRRAFRKLAPLKDRKVLDLARKAIHDRFESSLVRVDAVAAWKAEGGLWAVKVLLPAAAEAEPEVRAAIAEALGGVKGDPAAEAVYEGLRDSSTSVRLAVVGALATLDHPRAMHRLEGALRDREIEVRLAAIEAVAARRDPQSEKVLHREAQRSEGETVFAAIRALAGYPSAETLDLLGKLAGRGSPEARVTALEALGAAGTPEVLPLLGQALQSREWPVRVVAARQIGKLRVKEAVDLLVDRMAREQGRVLGDLADALRSLTGKALGYNAAHWKEWWSANREAFVFGAGEEAGPAGVGITTYHGLPVVSHRIIFCLDISGSMESPMGAGGETRLGHAKEELLRVLEGLDREARVNIVFFDDRVEPWMRSLVSVRSNLPRARALIDSVRSRGGTNIFDTLELCFKDSSVDTIYLLSDGEPNAGRLVDARDILAEIRRMNRGRQIVLHTVSLGPSEFMRKLAGESGGRCVEK